MLPHVALTGKARAGKDTAGRWLVERLGYHRVAFADGVREVALAIDPYVFGKLRLSAFVATYGWELAKEEPEVRRLLQVIGTEAGRNVFGEHVWVDLALRRAPTGVPLVFTDVRFPSEAEAVRRLGAVVVRIERAGDHASETALDGYPVDAVIRNDGTVDDLCEAVGAVARSTTHTP